MPGPQPSGNSTVPGSHVHGGGGKPVVIVHGGGGEASSQCDIEPSEPSDNELDEPNGPVEFCDACKPMWKECVSIAHHQFHHKTSPRIIRGVPNRLFRAAKKVWKRRPEQIVRKEEMERIGVNRTGTRLRMQALRSLKKQEKQARMQVVQNGPASEEA